MVFLSPLGRRDWGMFYSHIFPSGSRSALKKNLWQSYFPEVAAFSQIKKGVFSASVESQVSSG